MALMNGHSRGKLVKKFSELGPYIREEQCEEGRYFFDCLAVCVNAKTAPEKREFWGWWMVLEGQDGHAVAEYQYGLFDKAGDWQPLSFKNQEVTDQVAKTQQVFHARLEALLASLDIHLVTL